MSRAALTKLLILLILALIMCLPELFPSDQELEMPFSCLPFDPCDNESGHAAEAGFQAQTRPLCVGGSGNLTNQSAAHTEWYLCETQTNLHGIHGQTSLSGGSPRMFLMVRPDTLGPFNVTVHHKLDHSSLNNRSVFQCCDPAGAGPCLTLNTPSPSPTPTSPKLSPGLRETVTSASKPLQNGRPAQTHCLVPSNHMGAQGGTVCVRRVLWVALVMLIPLIALTAVVHQVYKGKTHRSLKKTERIKSSSSGFTKSPGHLPDVSVSICSTTEVAELTQQSATMETDAENLLTVYCSMYKRGLSPIHEISDRSETSLVEDEGDDDNDDHDDEVDDDNEEDEGEESVFLEHGAEHEAPAPPHHGMREPHTHLHHRGHPSILLSLSGE